MEPNINSQNQSEGKDASTTPAYHDPNIKAVRTYNSDAEEAVRTKNASVITIALAEKTKQRNDGDEPIVEQKSNTPLLIASVLLVLAGLGALIYFAFMTQQPSPSESKPIVPSLVSAELQFEIPIDGGTPPLQNLTTHQSKDYIPGTLVHMYFTATNTNGKRLATLEETLDALIIRPPSSLKRTLDPVFMAGYYSRATNEPFIILKNNFFESAFAGMLQWEQDLHDMFRRLGVTIPTVQGKFSDTIIKNKDVRVLNNEVGDPVMLYSFVDNNTIVIATSEETLRELIDRLNKQQFIR